MSHIGVPKLGGGGGGVPLSSTTFFGHMFFTTTNCESDHSISLKFIKVDQLPVANVLSALNLVRDLFIKGRQKWNNLSYFDNLLVI